MKLKNFLAGLVAIAVLSLPMIARAQAGNDFYGQPRFLVLQQPLFLTNTPNSATAVFSNAPVDIHGFDGVASVIFTATNDVYLSTATIYAYLQGSADRTNWYTLTNVSLTTATTYNITNISGLVTNGQGAVATNTYMLPGTVTTPNAAVAGFATPYLVPNPFTNSAVLLTNVLGGTAIIGFNIQDAPRYLQMAYTIAPAAATFTVSAVLVARKNSGAFFY